VRRASLYSFTARSRCPRCRRSGRAGAGPHLSPLGLEIAAQRLASVLAGTGSFLREEQVADAIVGKRGMRDLRAPLILLERVSKLADLLKLLAFTDRDTTRIWSENRSTRPSGSMVMVWVCRTSRSRTPTKCRPLDTLLFRIAFGLDSMSTGMRNV